MKKIVMGLWLVLIIFLTGCGKNFNSSPESVAEEMAKRLSDGDYKKISELIYFEEDGFIDEVSFKNYLVDNDLVIEGNEKYKVLSVDTYSDDSSSVVKVSIDNNRILKVNTVKKDEKWYVDLGSYVYDEDLTITVPVGSTVYLNNEKLDPKLYAESSKDKFKWTIGYTPYEVDYAIDIYAIPTLLSGEYNLRVENKNIKTVDEKIYTRKSQYDNDKQLFSSVKGLYYLKARANTSVESELKEFINNFYNDLFTSVENKEDFSKINKYFNKDNSTLVADYEKEYKELMEDLADESTYSTFSIYNSNLKSTLDYSDESSDIYYYGEDRYLIVSNRTFEYTETRKYNPKYFIDSSDRVSNEKKTGYILVEIKKTENGYVINGDLNLIPSV